jgi:hypothetical protein
MDQLEVTPALVRWTQGLERAEWLDGPVEALRPGVRSLFGSGTRGAVLRGDWLGHAVHPVLTDGVVGTWSSALLLDLFGGEESAAAARRLIGLGLVAAGPTAWSGWAEWSAAGQRAQRVGVVHAATNGAAIGLYAASWLARRRGRHATGVRWALAGATALGAGAYLGGHLASVRKVGTHHPAYDRG